MGLNQLPRADRSAITTFFWLWSFFEGNNLRERGDINEIRQLVQHWEDQGQLDLAPFEEALAYFRNRYFQNGVETEHFQHLHLEEHNNAVRTLARAVLSQQINNNRDQMIVLLIVIYRLRNNLFHGPKWQYRLGGQRENFLHANRVLKRAMEMDGRGLA